MLDDMVILVSGGTTGVGAAAARAAVNAGARAIAVTGRRAELLSPASGVATGSVLDWDQLVAGAHD